MTRLPGQRMAVLIAAATVGLSSAGCAGGGQRELPAPSPQRPRVLVVAPVVNLSGNQDFDALKVTDILASEFLSFPGISVVPVNLTLAALSRQGKARVDTPAQAIELAREFGADAAVVVAVTEYDPYDPPIVGLAMQWYTATGTGHGTERERAASAEKAPLPEAVRLSENDAAAPQLQLQRVFNAAHDDVVKELRSFAAGRDKDASPYAWRKYAKSQQLYVRYCCWAMIRTMLRQSALYYAPAEPAKADS